MAFIKKPILINENILTYEIIGPGTNFPLAGSKSLLAGTNSLVLILWEKNTSKAFEIPKLIRIQFMRNQFGQKATSKPWNCKFHTMTTHIHLCFEIQKKKKN